MMFSLKKADRYEFFNSMNNSYCHILKDAERMLFQLQLIYTERLGGDILNGKLIILP